MESNNPATSGCCLFCVCNGFIEAKEVFDPGDFQSLVDALIHAYQSQAASIFLSRDVGADERADPCRIRQGDTCEVENESARVVSTNLRLETEYIGQRQWPRQAQNADSFPRTWKIFDVQRQVRHARNVNGE